MSNANKLHFVLKLILILVIALLLVTVVTPTLLLPNSYAQAGTEVKCGSIVDGEFTKEGEIHEYVLAMATKESFNVSIEAVVDYLAFWMAANGPTGAQVAMSGWNHTKDPSMSTGMLAKGTYNSRFV